MKFLLLPALAGALLLGACGGDTAAEGSSTSQNDVGATQVAFTVDGLS